MSSVCINGFDQEKCEGDGIAIVDLAGGSTLKRPYHQRSPVGEHGSLIALCSTCLGTVKIVEKYSDRTKICLQRLKRRRQGAYTTIWQGLLNKIPKKVEPRTRRGTMSTMPAGSISESEYDRGARTNDFLLTKISGRR